MLKKVLKYLTSTIVIISLFIYYIIHIDGNFYKIDNDAYRSGQLNRYNLEYYLNKYQFKTILNLRGSSNDQWYKDELELSNRYNTKHIDYKISNRDYLDINRTKQIVQILKDAKKPILIHCAGGADRTSLVSALYQYAIKHKSKAISQDQFSIIYGHTPYFRPKVIAMDWSFDNYVKKTLKEKNETTK